MNPDNKKKILQRYTTFINMNQFLRKFIPTPLLTYASGIYPIMMIIHPCSNFPIRPWGWL